MKTSGRGLQPSGALGDKEFIDIEFGKAIETGYHQVPRLVTSSKGIRSGAGHGFVGYPCDGLEMIRLMVRGNVAAGADVIKFYATGTLMAFGQISCYLDQTEIQMIVDEAHRLGKQTAVQCVGGKAFDWCLEAGVDCIEHGYFLSDEEIEMLMRKEVDLVLTPSFYMREEQITSLPRHLIDEHRNQSSKARERMAAILNRQLNRYNVSIENAGFALL
jgi:imidazolonepropionase-like amidohydrolase